MLPLLIVRDQYHCYVLSFPIVRNVNMITNVMALLNELLCALKKKQAPQALH